MSTRLSHPSVDERRARGKAAREQVPPSEDAGWTPATDRPDPVRLLEEQNTTREPDLVPVRHGRMMVSPFTFYRGAAKIMATDLKDTPTAGLERPALRRRASLELRCVRVPRANTVVRRERLRRDAPRSLRIRRETDGGELHDRGVATTDSPRPTRATRRVVSVTVVSRGDGRVRRDVDAGHLVRPPCRNKI